MAQAQPVGLGDGQGYPPWVVVVEQPIVCPGDEQAAGIRPCILEETQVSQ